MRIAAILFSFLLVGACSGSTATGGGGGSGDDAGGGSSSGGSSGSGSSSGSSSSGSGSSGGKSGSGSGSSGGKNGSSSGGSSGSGSSSGKSGSSSGSGNDGGFVCESPGDCSKGDVCCVHIPINGGTVPNCNAGTPTVACSSASACPSNVPFSCMNQVVNLCKTSSDCANEAGGYTECCTFGNGGGALTFCATSLVAIGATSCAH